ncbi:hypothetical protein KAR91_36670 [Candidatus Pacearchaeota archaeon]|nr:hypothetical protein [Candidatus Pacearchaeota archaeon]
MWNHLVRVTREKEAYVKGINEDGVGYTHNRGHAMRTNPFRAKYLAFMITHENEENARKEVY